MILIVLFLDLVVDRRMNRKSDKKSESLRAEANRFYVQKKFFAALIKYNESLCCAESGSENAGLAFANRSAVYFELKLYEQCLNNIELARRHNYPQKNLELLAKREAKCKEARDGQAHKSTPWDFFKLSHPAKRETPFIADCLEMKTNGKHGRHLVTTRALRVGDIVIVDEPTFKVIKADSRYATCYDSNAFQRCANCLDDNLLDLIACTACCKTMFCSLECLEAAKSHHETECEIVDDLLSSGLVHIVMRIFLEGLSSFGGDLDDMKTSLSQVESSNMTILDRGCLKDKKHKFLATISLASSETGGDLFDSCLKMFARTEKLTKIFKSDPKFVTSVLGKLVTVGIHYVHGIGGWSRNQNGMENFDYPKHPSQYQQVIGNGCNLVASLLNHSCAPNIRRMNVDDKTVVIVIRPVLKGDQLFDSYRPNFNVVSRAQRRETLLKDYGFDCDCEACTNNWPLNHELKVADEELLQFAWETHEDLPLLSCDEAKSKLKACCKLFAENHRDFPSAELVVLQECIANCLIAITKPSPQFN